MRTGSWSHRLWFWGCPPLAGQIDTTRATGRLVRDVMVVWQRLHFRFGLHKPLLEPGAVERL